MELNIIWFILYTVLIIGYAILDGFDLGVGILHLFARSEKERRIHLNAIGPVWDGNEVWLLTAGGALFAAFPIVYATVFSSFYLALMLLLAALIARAVSLEFRGKVESPTWRKIWDRAFGLGSLVAALLFGVAVGNILNGIPINSEGTFTGSFIGLLNPYSLLVGILTVSLFTMHGAVWMALKSEGELMDRMKQWIKTFWMAFVMIYFAVTLASFFVTPHLFDGLTDNPLFWLFVVLLIAGMVYIPVATRCARFGRAFLASSTVILAMNGLAAVGLFPRLVPSSIDLNYSLTIYNASSTPLTLTVMLIIALIGMPLVIGYTIWIYRAFKGKVVLTDDSY